MRLLRLSRLEPAVARVSAELDVAAKKSNINRHLSRITLQTSEVLLVSCLCLCCCPIPSWPGGGRVLERLLPSYPLAVRQIGRPCLLSQMLRWLPRWAYNNGRFRAPNRKCTRCEASDSWHPAEGCKCGGVLPLGRHIRPISGGTATGNCAERAAAGHVHDCVASYAACCSIEAIRGCYTQSIQWTTEQMPVPTPAIRGKSLLNGKISRSAPRRLAAASEHNPKSRTATT